MCFLKRCPKPKISVPISINNKDAGAKDSKKVWEVDDKFLSVILIFYSFSCIMMR